MTVHELHAQALDGRWEVIGRDRLVGITPELDSVEADLEGPSAIGFTLHRDPAVVWPDLGADTPLSYRADGLEVWAGRIREAPTNDDQAAREVRVSGVGWAAHLDDAHMRPVLLCTQIGLLRDTRELLGASLSVYQVSGTVNVGRAAALAFPHNTSPAAGAAGSVGATLNLEADSWVDTFEVDYTHSNNDAAFSFYVIAGANSPDNGIASADASASVALTGGASGTLVLTVQARVRWLTVLLVRTSGTGAITNARTVKITGMRVSGKAGYTAAGASALLASDVVTRALDGAPLLDSDRSLIAATSNVLPDFTLTEVRTPHELIDDVNQLEARQFRVRPDRRAEYRAFPTSPTVELTGPVEDASASSADDVANRVLVEYTSPSGDAAVAEVWSVDAFPGQTEDAGTITNPGFESGTTTGWTTTLGSLATSTATPHTGTRIGRLTTDALSANALTKTTITGLTPGVPLVAELYVRGLSGATTIGDPIEFSIVGTPLAYAFNAGLAFAAGSVWTKLSIFIPPEYVTGTSLTVQLFTRSTIALLSTPILDFDDLRVYRSTATLVDRRKFVRSTVISTGLAATATIARQLGIAYLQIHASTLMKGTATVRRGEARDPRTGAPIRPADLLLCTGELALLANQRDPDTGASHREARIVAVSYNPAEDTASVTLDNDRDRFDALVGRLALAQGAR